MVEEKKLKSEYFEFKGFLSFLIMHEIKSKALSGDELAVKIGKRKGTILTPGTIYPALKNLRKKKLIKFKQSGRKKYYSLTDVGEKELENLYMVFSRYFFGLKKHIKKQ